MTTETTHLTSERITTRTTVRKSVYMDTSKKYTANGKLYRHKRWRADVRTLGPDGPGRIRARFSTREAAVRWLQGF